MTRRWGRDPFRTGLVQAVEGVARQALATSGTPGLAVALVHHGQVVWAAGYGVADRTMGQPVTADLSVHGYVGQPPDRTLPSTVSSLAGETGDGFPVELLEAPGRGWLYSGGGYSLLQLLVEELTGRPFVDYMQAEVLEPLGMTASSFRWSRTAQTARPHDAGGPVPDFAFAEQAAAGLVTTAPDLARFLAAGWPARVASLRVVDGGADRDHDVREDRPGRPARRAPHRPRPRRPWGPHARQPGRRMTLTGGPYHARHDHLAHGGPDGSRP